MGGAVVDALEEADGFRVAAIVDARSETPPAADVFVDFTLPGATPAIAALAVERSRGLVVGTTGLTPIDERALLDASERIPVLASPNMSIGVNLLYELARLTAGVLEGAEIEILDLHHRHKVDAPSGTARELVRVIQEERGAEGGVRYGREGRVGERRRDEIAVHAIRAGEIVGEHTVLFATDGERVELTHRAADRRAFAAGTLHAIRFVSGRSTGFYRMRDALSLGVD